MYIIRAEVWGGITGHRVGGLRDDDGNVRKFDNLEVAQAEADRLNIEMNEPPKTANFRYTVIEDYS